MDDPTRKATYINLVLLALSDGKITPQETAYLKRFKDAASISDEDADRWTREATSNRAFRAVSDIDEVMQTFILTARMVRVDDEFAPAEQEAFIALGKAIGVAPERLGPALREVWNRDPEAIFEKIAATSAPQRIAPLIVLEDDAIDKSSLEAAASGLSLRFVSPTSFAGLTPDPRAILFHIPDDRAESKERLLALKRRFQTAFIAFIARRDQAPQIGLLLEAGADRCFVAPLYPNEITRAVRDTLTT